MNSRSSLLSWYDTGKPVEHLIAGCLILASFILLVTSAWFSEGSFTGIGGDNMMHFQFAHFSWKHPELFLNHTAKPLFTLLCSPLSQFGFFGAQLFNILAGLTTAWISYMILSRLGYKNAYLVIIFVVFAPIYFMMQMTSLTEILFSMLLMLSLYLYLSEYFLISALVLSFLPFARTEAIVIIPFFAVAFLYNRKWLALPLLLTGFLLYSFIGMNYHHDFLWYINQNAPPDASSIYGSGPLLHFVQNTRYIFGYPIACLFAAGVVFLLVKLTRNSKVERQKAITILWLIFLPFIAFFMLHSFLWWKGMGGSLGLIRIIASVVPLCCIISFIAYATISEWLSHYRLIAVLFMLLISFFIVRANFAINQIPVKLDPGSKLIKKTTEFIKKENLIHKVIYYYDPLVTFYLDLDPWNTKTSHSLIWDGGVDDEKFYADSSLLIWDSHFGPNEGNMPLDSLINKTFLQLVAVFKPDQPFKTLGGHDYEVYVFRKLPSGADKADNKKILDQMNSIDPSQSSVYSILNMEFESDTLKKSLRNITSEMSYMGNHSYKMIGTDLYSPGATVLISSINPLLTYPFRIEASAYVLLKTKPETNQISLVITIENNGKSSIYQSIDLGTNITSGKWNKLSTYITINNRLLPSDKIKVYLWHRGKEELFIDDLTSEIRTNK